MPPMMWKRTLNSTTRAAVVFLSLLASTQTTTNGFTFVTRNEACVVRMNKYATLFSSRLFMVYAPPGSGYAGPEDETTELPDTYEPMMEYPGTMRPGRTPENMPYHDLPLGIDEPDPIPWPHLQEIEWHHRWEPPHPHPIPMEEFIEQQGRWATPEMEAAMRAGNRRDARTRREMEQEKKRDTLIVDDDEDDETDEPQDLGEGVFGRLGSVVDQALAAAATSPDTASQPKQEEEEAPDDNAGLDDFLLDLGLDSLGSEPEEDERKKPEASVREEVPPTVTKSQAQTAGLEDVVVGDDDVDDIADGGMASGTEGVTASIDVNDDDDVDLGLEDEDDIQSGGVSTVPLEDFSDGDNMDSENFFDDGGFDYDDSGGDSDGGDW